jgi:hypothetical protein
MAKATNDEKDKEALLLGATALRKMAPDELALSVLLDIARQSDDVRIQEAVRRLDGS